jgi:hypothetical protein
MTRSASRLTSAAERRHLGSPARQRWGHTPFLNDFKPRSGDIAVEETPVFIGISEKNVAAPRLISSLKSIGPNAQGRVAQLALRACAGTFRDPCRGRLSLPFGSGGGAPKALATG